MKNKIAIILMFIAFVFAACSNREEIIEGNEFTKPNTDNTESTVTHEEQTEHNSKDRENYTYSFNSYLALSSFVSQEENDVAKGNSENAKQDASYQAFIHHLNERGIPIPCVSDQPFVLEENNIRDPITVFSCELYYWPWIWYRTTMNELTVTISIAILDSDMISVGQNKTMSEFVRYIAPSAPNVDNYQNFDNLSSVYEINIQTEKGSQSAIVQETTSGYVYVHFLQNEYYILLRADKSVAFGEWLSRFGLREYVETEVA